MSCNYDVSLSSYWFSKNGVAELINMRVMVTKLGIDWIVTEVKFVLAPHTNYYTYPVAPQTIRPSPTGTVNNVGHWQSL